MKFVGIQDQGFAIHKAIETEMAARPILTRVGSDDDEEQYMGKSILPVSQEKIIDDTFVPATGEDYLLMVRRQTRRVPAVVVAAPPPETKKFSASTLPSHYQFQVEQVTPTSENLLPKDAWRTAFRARFDGIKESFSQLSQLPHNEIKLPAAKDKKQWKEFLYGAPKIEGGSDHSEGHNPDVNILQRISQNVALKLLNWHIEWLENNEIQKNQAMWMYALLTRLDKVMTSDETSTLRNVSRKCIQIRQEQTDPENPQVAYLNILITIIATCFGQADLV